MAQEDRLARIVRARRRTDGYCRSRLSCKAHGTREDAAAWADVYTQVFPAYRLLIEAAAQDVVKTAKCWIHSANLPPRAGRLLSVHEQTTLNVRILLDRFGATPIVAPVAPSGQAAIQYGEVSEVAEGARTESVYTATYRGSNPLTAIFKLSLYRSTGFCLSPTKGMRTPDGVRHKNAGAF